MPTDISRRMFLKTLGTCGAAFALTGVAGNAAAARTESWKQRMHDESRLLMDTIVRITVARTSRQQAADAMGLAFAEMERLIAVFDRHRPGTAISALNERGKLHDAPPEFVALIRQASQYGVLSGGAFDITVLPVLELFASRSNPGGNLLVDRRELAQTLALVDAAGVRVDGCSVSLARIGMGVTLDGIAKGYIVDQAALALEKAGVRHYLINAGGDIRCGGEKRPGVTWTVAVEDPAKSRSFPAVMGMRGGAVATSGIYERFYDKSREHSHLITPSTGLSPADSLSVTVKAPTTVQADALATALSVMSREQGIALMDRLPDCACLYVLKNGSQAASARWKSA